MNWEKVIEKLDEDATYWLGKSQTPQLIIGGILNALSKALKAGLEEKK